MFQFKKV